ncbi:MAG TPA: ATP-binding protein [Burkholderiales bacterium]|nr:ATP-binding protein [Burkholderiales bacterium]
MSLFARSFLLIAALIVTAVLASFQIYRIYELEPRSRELAQQTVSTVNLTRAALVSADPFLRRDLLVELNETEGLRVFPATASEKLEALPEDELLERVEKRVREALGADTRFAFARDGEEGFLVSFFIDEDEFWVMLPRERFDPVFGLQWLGWGAALLALALVGAWLIASNLARSLAALGRAAGRLGRGEAHQPLAETGPRELRSVAAAFNRMASDLDSMERERAMVLAGISHDLRTPLSRMRLALEMSGATTDEMRDYGAAIVADIEEIDAIIGQFLDFARGANEQKTRQDPRPLLEELAEHYARLGKNIAMKSDGAAPFSFARMALRRALGNLIDNALRYAGEPVEVELRHTPGEVLIEVRDRGPGIPRSETERLKRPFTRLDAARSGPVGSGLGLAIVERVARAHGGRLDLAPRDGGGLVARLVMAAR